MQDSCTAGTPGGSDATCDGNDDDCDGSTDEDYSPVSTSCGVGACASSGSTSCVGGSVQEGSTDLTPAGADATSDGLEGDCDGPNHEDHAPTATNSGTGVRVARGLSIGDGRF